MMGAWLGGHLKNWLAPKTAGLWRSTTLPEGANISWGGTFYAIPKQSKNKELAWSLVKHLTLSQAQQEAAFVTHDAFPALVSAHDSGSLMRPSHFLETKLLDPLGGRPRWLLYLQRYSSMTLSPKRLSMLSSILSLQRVRVWSDAIADAERMVARRARR